MVMGRPKAALVLSPAQREQLERMASSRSLPAGLVIRVTEEFRSSPEATIEDRLRIALFHASRRGSMGNLVRGCFGLRFVLLDFGFEDRSMKFECSTLRLALRFLSMVLGRTS